jgi:hypothetical protein
MNFSEENSVWVEIKGKPEQQEVVFNLPDNTIPTQLRLDLGVNKDQEEMEIKNFKMDYMGKTFEVHGANFFTYFSPNLECTTIDRARYTIKPIKKEKGYFGPSFYPEPLVAQEISKLVR